MEPLTFKGREGSGAPGGRCAYADARLNPDQDWKKFELYYRVWGRKLYDPDANAEAWRRVMRSDFGRGRGAGGDGGGAGEPNFAAGDFGASAFGIESLHSGRRLNTNMPMVMGSEKSPYSDTPEPKCFGTVSPLDPQMFSTVVEHADDLLAERPNPKYSPIEVAQCAGGHGGDFDGSAERGAREDPRRSAEFRRMEEDVLIQIGLGTFFAKKLRSAVLWEIAQKTGNGNAARLALAQYQAARAAWATMAGRAKSVYRGDIGYGDVAMRRGHWMDRLPAIDVDLAAMQAKVSGGGLGASVAPQAEGAVRAALGRPTRPTLPVTHEPAETFTPGQPLHVVLSAGGEAIKPGITARLHYRHADQAERWTWLEMERVGRGWGGTIAGAYTQSAFPLEYYFELRRGNNAWMAPGFNETLSNQPYYAVWRREASIRVQGSGIRN